jgi:hypothetical protein
MNFDWSIAPALIAASLAAIFVIWEQWGPEKKWKSWKLWLALVFLVSSCVAVVVESAVTSAQEKQRQADLLLIQEQNMALNSLCFELQLQPYDTVWNKGCDLQIETWMSVAATLVRSGLIAEYIHFQFHPDTGWYRSKTSVYAWPSIVLRKDTATNTVRFEMMPFGIRSMKDATLLYWRAERLADLSRVHFEFSLMYSAEFPKQRNPPIYDDLTPPNLSWNPIKNICLYANSFESENLITRLVPMERKHSDQHNFIYFHPEGQPVTDWDNFKFYVDLQQMRPYILERLK